MVCPGVEGEDGLAIDTEIGQRADPAQPVDFVGTILARFQTGTRHT
jgi:hypothetical protein